ncbi:4-oxalomesaconate tautomerase [Verminephrobacter eiseniae]|uniref:4-oxalomesaconate tautomerase n=1 Tax=Verminephrobacter eiseniae TaxID=364317 RepID=UPI002237FE9F|nr:4-oxalomesaconate tautomerase [Verminephrobacter eiseniae]MCW5233127.1 4-oxalomesaconate tautomerase [Verminephrobacter eiseniae]MCW5295318.1 4-oxalomesaconate tautomerase [Verminephrobacter eiseniae]MCW8183590.1 4-oxalomesaconate tautomerase [Verminephrobacter eiseniae]MCW8223405.1 4-oxalomesaconate tautomerase [Verminephrobacter eiseniae]MCW8233373.1 4-oxalomesaconate tautomerase [Verminephrobacter eiseniae]
MSYHLPCVLMRGGTSRGPFFLADWLPQDPLQRDRTLIAALGSPHELQIDGLGGGHSLTSKVAIVSRSVHAGCDVDYLFAQVSVGEARVDTRPNCGNMLAGVGPFAIEQGLVHAGRQADVTQVRVYNLNTGARIDLQVQTRDGRVRYEGDMRIDGVQGTAAPVLMSFRDAWGAVTGQLFPTGQRIDTIAGLQVTCIDAAQVMVLVPAAALGLRGDESAAELDADTALLARLQALRCQAGLRMGLGGIPDSVLPKPVLVAPGPAPGSIVSRYFTPWRCHRSHAVTGAIGVAAALLLPGTVATDARTPASAGTHRVQVLHPAGRTHVDVQLALVDGHCTLVQAALVRTARKIFEGTLFVAQSAMAPGCPGPWPADDRP